MVYLAFGEVSFFSVIISPYNNKFFQDSFRTPHRARNLEGHRIILGDEIKKNCLWQMESHEVII